MTTELIFSTSPRLSFSRDHHHHRTEGSPLPESEGTADFNFIVSFPPAANDASIADELFSDGKILPFYKSPAESKKQSPVIPNIVRSSSLGSAVQQPGPVSALPLNRCKSAGSAPPHRLRSGSNRRKKIYYFSGSESGSHAAGVRISPVLNIPAPVITASGDSGHGATCRAISGIFEYLLCNCGGERKHGEAEDD